MAESIWKGSRIHGECDYNLRMIPSALVFSALAFKRCCTWVLIASAIHLRVETSLAFTCLASNWAHPDENWRTVFKWENNPSGGGGGSRDEQLGLVHRCVKCCHYHKRWGYAPVQWKSQVQINHITEIIREESQSTSPSYRQCCHWSERRLSGQ